MMLGGTGIIATAPVTAAGIPFLASVAKALPTMQKIVGDDDAYKYFEDTLRDVRVKHTYLIEQIHPGIYCSLRHQVRRRSSRTIREEDKGERATISKWALIFNKHRSKTRIERLEEVAIDEPNQSIG